LLDFNQEPEIPFCECQWQVETKEIDMKAQITLFALITVMLVACGDDQVDPRYTDGVGVDHYVPYWPASNDRQSRMKVRALSMDAELPDAESQNAGPEAQHKQATNEPRSPG
jgi:hypothetical protein